MLATAGNYPCVAQSSTPQPVGIFEGHTDVGLVLHEGSSVFDRSSGTYAVSCSGENMWSDFDNFQFAWKKVSDHVALSAEMSFLQKSGDAHRKTVLMIRQTLDPDAVYADVAVHGDGLASLECRDTFTLSRSKAAKRLNSRPRKVSMTVRNILPTENTFILIRNVPAACKSGACADGSAQEQVTSDEFNNWFPHLSPDGEWMVFLSYGKDVQGHPESRDVTLRITTSRRQYCREN